MLPKIKMLNPNVKAVIFDLNGIFLESQPLSIRISQKYGVNENIFWEKFKDVLKIVRASDTYSPDVWSPITDYLNVPLEDFFEFWFSGEKINYELLDYVKELRKNNLKIFILSNNLKYRTEYYRSHFPDFFGVFDGVYFSWETGFIKPDPQAFQNILTQNNLKPEECIYFDDSNINIESGQKLGISSYLYTGISQVKNILKI